MKIAAVFPGQGTQRIGMGCALHARYDVARDVFHRASTCLDIDLAAMCFRGDPNELMATRIAQPAIFTVSCAALAVLRSFDLRPSCAAGHSVGEIAALYAADVLDFETALHVVRRRAEIMATINSDGAMVAVVGLDRNAVADACDEVARLQLGPVGIGLDNAPKHLVVSGATPAVLAAVERCRSLGALKIARLHTQLAFHSPLMEPVLDEWRAFVATVAFQEPRIPVALNATGAAASGIQDIHHAVIAQVVSTVRWTECVKTLLRMGANQFVEVGDTKVISSLIRATDSAVATTTMSDARAWRRLKGNLAAGRGAGDVVS